MMVLRGEDLLAGKVDVGEFILELLKILSYTENPLPPSLQLAFPYGVA
jgi:hypothetical protein